MINTGLDTRNVRALAIDPVTPTTLYAGTGGGGVYKSTNGGNNWSVMNTGLLNNGLPEREAVAFAIDPASPSTLYVGTGTEGIGSASSFRGGVFKSTNGGTSWSATNFTDTLVNALAIDPVAPSTIYAGTPIGADAFVAQLNPTGTTITYSTYLAAVAKIKVLE